MNKFTVHIPAFVDYREDPPAYEFETLEELKAIPHVKQAAGIPNFSHYAITERYLMSISDGGKHWWVLGYIRDPTAVDLPQWDHGITDVEYPDGRRATISGTQIRQYCGNDVTLLDGTVVKHIRSECSTAPPILTKE